MELSESEYIELLESAQRSEALLNKCAEMLSSIDKQMPEVPGYVFHKEQLRTVANTLGHTQAQLHIIQSTLNRAIKNGEG